MYRRNEEQMEMLKVSEMMVDGVFNEYDKHKLDKMDFASACSFVCGFLYATFGESDRYEFMEALIKSLIDTYHSAGGACDEKE